MEMVLLFAAIALAIVEHFYQPIIEYLAKLSDTNPNLVPIVDALTFAEQYVQAIVAGLLCWFGGANLFPDLPPTLGLILTAAVALFAQDIVSAVKLWPRRLAEEQFVTAVALSEQGILPVTLGTVQYIKEEKP